MAQVTEKFVDEVGGATDNGSNASNTLAAFLRVASELFETRPTFTESDFLYLAKRYSLPIRETKELFAKWTSSLQDWCKLDKVAGCYDQDVYIRLS
jgi:hypothetical protein